VVDEAVDVRPEVRNGITPSCASSPAERDRPQRPRIHLPTGGTPVKDIMDAADRHAVASDDVLTDQ
jgi:hypothetical protein